MIGVLVLLAVAGAADGDIAALFKEARQAEQRGDFASAIAKYDQVLAINPAIAEVWANKGLILYGLDRHREALAAFERAVRLKPQLTNAQVFLGAEHLRFGNAPKAAASLEAALAVEPGNVHAMLALAGARAQLGQYQRAIGLYRQVVAREPGREEARYGIAVAYLNWSKSAARALVDSSSPYGELLTAEYLAIAGFPEAAQTKYEAVRAALPDSPEVAESFARTSAHAGGAGMKPITPGAAGRAIAGDPLGPAVRAWRAGQYDKASGLLRARPGDDRAKYWLSLVCRAQAREALLDAARASPASYRTHLLLADMARSTGDTALARTEYEKAATLAGDPETALTLIQFLAPLDAPAALGHAKRALSRLPAHPGLNCAAGRLLLKDGAAAEAGRLFRRALDADPTLAPARAGLADTLAATGDVASAIPEMERVLKNDPDGNWHYRLARWYQAAGRAEDAQRAFAATARLKEEVRRREQARFLEVTSAAPSAPGGGPGTTR